MGELNKTQRLAMECLREVLRHWEQFGEPMSGRHVEIRFGSTWASLKSELFFTTFLHNLETAELLKVFRTRTGKRWVFSFEVWESFDAETRVKWESRMNDRSDIIYSVEAYGRRPTTDKAGGK